MQQSSDALALSDAALDSHEEGGNPLYNLLTTPLVRVVSDGEEQSLTLPEIYAALAADSVDDFTNLRPHQRHYWHATLCQIGAIAMVNAGETDPPQNPERWSEMLSILTERDFPDHEPWHLVVPDITKPAFLQPPASEPGKASDYNRIILTPDSVDLQVGSKHHDVRDVNMRRPEPDQWLFALVSRQAGGGFDGNRLYGISRMNGGFGNRHGFSRTPSTRWGVHVMRDIRALELSHRGKQVDHLLLWTRPWNGSKVESIPFPDLEPWPLYVEISRRIRLEHDASGRLQGRYANSLGPRVHSAEMKGQTQDPWAIMDLAKGQAVTVSNRGFDYRKITEYLDREKFDLPALAQPVRGVDGNTPMHLVARALVRGQGGTEGYHEITIPMGRNMSRMLGSPAQADLHSVAEKRVNVIGEVQNILGHAAKAYLQDGDSSGKTKDEHAKVIAGARLSLNQSMDLDFWDDLETELASTDPEAVRSHWCYEVLIPRARQILEGVTHSGLCHRNDRYKAMVEALDLFGRRVNASKKLPSKPVESEDPA